VEVEAVVDASTVRRWLEEAAASVREQRDYLTQLDAAIGDADHGTNMDLSLITHLTLPTTERV
jgi:dihydroxyacetone kinase-like protein